MIFFLLKLKNIFFCKFMETLGNKNQPKSAFKYYCTICHYGTCKKCNYEDHIVSSKHTKNTAGNISESIGNTNQPKISSLNFCCDKCIF